MGRKPVSHWGEAFIPNFLSWKTFGMHELYRANSPWWELLGPVSVSQLGCSCPPYSGVTSLVTQ